MITLLYFLLLVLGLFVRKNKVLYIVQLLLVFLMMAGSRGLADEAIYLDRFQQGTSFYMSTEILYAFFIKTIHLFTNDYYVFLFIESLLYCILCFLITRKFSDNPCFVLSLMMLYPLFMDTTQQRQTLAMVFGWLGLYIFFTFKLKNNKFSILGLLLLLISGFIHVSTFLYLVVIIPLLLKKMKLRIIYYFGVFVLCIFLNSSNVILFFGNAIGMGDKVKQMLEVAASYNLTSTILFATLYILNFALFVCLYLIRRSQLGGRQKAFYLYLLRCNVAMVSLIPLIVLDNDIYRIQQLLYIFNYCAISNLFIGHFWKDKIVFNTKNVLVVASSVAVSFAILYLVILSSNSIDRVFYPFFNNNYFFNLQL